MAIARLRPASAHNRDVAVLSGQGQRRDVVLVAKRRVSMRSQELLYQFDLEQHGNTRTGVNLPLLSSRSALSHYLAALDKHIQNGLLILNSTQDSYF